VSVTRWSAALIVVGALAFAGGQTAEASCAGGGPGSPSLGDRIAAAPTVFVGTVVYTSDQDRVARVKVESIWRGPQLPAYLDVHGSPVSGPFVASSVDRHYQSGRRYLFVPVNANPPFDDNSCSLTQPYTAELTAYAPGDARAPGPATLADTFQNFVGQNAWSVPLLVLVLAALALAALIRVRRRPRQRT
jgi:hypothetical protein